MKANGVSEKLQTHDSLSNLDSMQKMQIRHFDAGKLLRNAVKSMRAGVLPEDPMKGVQEGTCSDLGVAPPNLPLLLFLLFLLFLTITILIIVLLVITIVVYDCSCCCYFVATTRTLLLLS